MSIENSLDNIGVKALVSAGNYAYLQIPADDLRLFFDNLFPWFAKCPIADVAKGYGHRWEAGHDLFIDVPNTLQTHGLKESFRQAGHILLTDFPTKSGIPIPGLSKSGLGKFLVETCGISKGYLSINIVDTTVGILACTEATSDLFNVIANNLRMTPELFWDTFVEGCAEIAAGVEIHNPLLLIAGIEQVSAGLISTFNTITNPAWFVNPIDFFSGCFTGAILSIFVSKFILKKSNKECIQNAAKSFILGGLFSISVWFGLGGIIILVSCGIGKLLAEKNTSTKQLYYKINIDEIISLREKLNITLEENTINFELLDSQKVDLENDISGFEEITINEAVSKLIELDDSKLAFIEDDSSIVFQDLLAKIDL
jgi:hypothetical protein